MRDNAAHLENQVLRKAAMALGIHHRLSVAESVSTNGAVERIMQKVVQTLRATLVEQKKSLGEWNGVALGAVGADHVMETEQHLAVYFDAWKGTSNRVCNDGGRAGRWVLGRGAGLEGSVAGSEAFCQGVGRDAPRCSPA